MLEDDELERIRIDPDFEETLLDVLDFYGINKVSLFPDLDGLSEHENWKHRKLT